jgi:hypothetical protein
MGRCEDMIEGGQVVKKKKSIFRIDKSWKSHASIVVLCISFPFSRPFSGLKYTPKLVNINLNFISMR